MNAPDRIIPTEDRTKWLGGSDAAAVMEIDQRINSLLAIEMAPEVPA